MIHEILLDRDIVWNDRENNNFFGINFDNNHNELFDLILNKEKTYLNLKSS